VKTCDICGSPARQVVRGYVGDKLVEVHLCDRCDQSVYKNKLTVLDLVNIVKNAEGRYCPVCGTTEKDFEATFKFGCADCYKYMSGIALMAAERVQDGLTHVGKRL
jgi:protein-arginine kinase activator protein McsA